jgi:hypothetical protein
MTAILTIGNRLDIRWTPIPLVPNTSLTMANFPHIFSWGNMRIPAPYQFRRDEHHTSAHDVRCFEELGAFSHHHDNDDTLYRRLGPNLWKPTRQYQPLESQ